MITITLIGSQNTKYHLGLVSVLSPKLTIKYYKKLSNKIAYSQNAFLSNGNCIPNFEKGFLILDIQGRAQPLEKGGGGVSRIMTLYDKGGVLDPPNLYDIICEQPLVGYLVCQLFFISLSYLVGFQYDFYNSYLLCGLESQ